MKNLVVKIATFVCIASIGLSEFSVLNAEVNDTEKVEQVETVKQEKTEKTEQVKQEKTEKKKKKKKKSSKKNKVRIEKNESIKIGSQYYSEEEAKVILLSKQTKLKKDYIKCVVESCSKYDNKLLTPELIISVIERESNCDPSAISSCNAQGLMQIIPKWQTKRMNKLGVRSLMDPCSNIKVGVDYLDFLLKEYDGNYYKALMFYNAGYAGLNKAKRGNYSSYAKGVVNRMNELESKCALE